MQAKGEWLKEECVEIGIMRIIDTLDINKGIKEDKNRSFRACIKLYIYKKYFNDRTNIWTSSASNVQYT